jgi:phage terminase large subunit-like protein
MEFSQTNENLTEASSNLFELIKQRNLLMDVDAEVKVAINRAVAVENSRGWRIAKEKTGHRIDVVVALAMAGLRAVRNGQDSRWLPPIETRKGSFYAKCRRELPDGQPYIPLRGLKFCSQDCAW